MVRERLLEGAGLELAPGGSVHQRLNQDATLSAGCAHFPTAAERKQVPEEDGPGGRMSDSCPWILGPGNLGVLLRACQSQARGKRQRSWNQNSGSRLWVKQVARGRDGASWGHGPRWDGG